MGQKLVSKDDVDNPFPEDDAKGPPLGDVEALPLTFEWSANGYETLPSDFEWSGYTGEYSDMKAGQWLYIWMQINGQEARLRAPLKNAKPALETALKGC